MEILGWKVWISDGTVFSSKNSSVSDIPSNDIQIIMLYHTFPYRTIQMGEDVYTLENFTLLGKEIDYSEFESIVEIAMADMEWPE